MSFRLSARRILLAALSLLTFGQSLCAHAGTRRGSVSVGGYVRKDGTYVQPHMRSAPDGAFFNNWSTRGNINPYTGEQGSLSSPNSGGLIGSGKVGGSVHAVVSRADAFKSTRQSALGGNSVSQNNLGVMYAIGDGVRQNFDEASKWFKKAMENGNLHGQAHLGQAYVFGHGVEQDVCKGFGLIRAAADLRNSTAEKIRTHLQCEWDPTFTATIARFESLQELRKAAGSGDPDAASLLGAFYLEGTNSLKKNAKEALKWSRMAADKGSHDAQLNVGFIYEMGLGVATNKNEALLWYSKAAEKQTAKAFCALGDLFYDGIGVFQDNAAQAVKWYRRAAELGDAYGQANLGECFYTGSGVEQDYRRAWEWFLKAAEQGNSWAQCNVGYLLQTGEGVAKDIAEAIKWYRQAAKQGDPTAQLNLGECYRDGEGVLQSYVEAYRWFNLAANNGLKDAVSARKELVRKMTKEQIAEGQKSASLSPHE